MYSSQPVVTGQRGWSVTLGFWPTHSGWSGFRAACARLAASAALAADMRWRRNAVDTLPPAVLPSVGSGAGPVAGTRTLPSRLLPGMARLVFTCPPSVSGRSALRDCCLPDWSCPPSCFASRHEFSPALPHFFSQAGLSQSLMVAFLQSSPDPARGGGGAAASEVSAISTPNEKRTRRPAAMSMRALPARDSSRGRQTGGD